MLKNYLKLAWRVLFRRKFFTFISLFGISFTLMVLMLFTAAFQTELGSKKPFTKQEDMVSMILLELRQEHFDTIPEIDSSLIGGIMTYDTVSYRTESAGASANNSNLSRSILTDYYADAKEAELMTIYESGSEFDIYKDNTKFSVKVNYADAEFWKVFDFEFLSGEPFSVNDFEQEAQRIVIAEEFAVKYFGTVNGALNQELLMDGKNFKVIGVVKKPVMSFRAVQQDIFLPYTLMPKNERESFYHGGFNAMFVAKNDREKLKKELSHITTLIPQDRKEGYNEVHMYPMTIAEQFAKGFINEKDPADSYRIMSYILMGLIGLFILLPTLNLINLNVSRIFDRSSEIGVRKAFGAAQGNIIMQFVFENIILTILGGILGFVLALLMMKVVNTYGLLDDSSLYIDFKFSFYAILITIAFGILSGLLPAYRMSKTQIVTALKQNQL